MQTAHLDKPTVLVVDDDEDMLIMMQHLLIAEGYEPLISPNAQNAMAIISRRRPAMVLLDIKMNGVDGANICQRIKANAATAEIPIIILSGSPDIDTIAQACGADAYLAKPFNLQKFKELLHQLVG